MVAPSRVVEHFASELKERLVENEEGKLIETVSVSKQEFEQTLGRSFPLGST